MITLVHVLVDQRVNDLRCGLAGGQQLEVLANFLVAGVVDDLSQVRRPQAGTGPLAKR